MPRPSFDWGLFLSRPTTKTLPVEILKAVVDQVKDTGTLFSLLTTNRAVFAIASNTLYRDIISFTAGSCKLKSDRLIDMVLAHSLAEDDDTNLYRELCDVQKLDGKPFANYLSMVQVLDLSGGNLVHHISSHGYLSLWSLMERRRGVTDLVKLAEWVYNTLTWAMLYGHFSNIQSLSIHTHHVQQYQVAIPSLTSLRHLKFDRGFHMLDDHNVEESSMLEALRFVENFVQHHGHGQLKTCDFGNMFKWQPLNSKYIELEMRIQKLIGPPSSLTSVGRHNWATILSFADRLDLTKIKDWRQPQDSTEWWDQLARYWPNLSQQSILQQCRSLETLTANFFDPDALKWAAAERATHVTKGEPQQLIPLKSVHCMTNNQAMHSVTNGLLKGFGETLEQLCTVACRELPTNAKMTLGEGWHTMPNLRELKIKTPLEIVVRPGAFEATPALERLMLQDPPREDSQEPDEEQIRVSTVWKLPKLASLDLSGSVADLMDPGSLAYMPSLQSLTIVGFCGIGIDSVPRPGSFADLQQHLWMWDIGLPQLTRLYLKGHHAARFRFGFLRLCPSLITVCLDVGYHRAFLSDDLDLDCLVGGNGPDKQPTNSNAFTSQSSLRTLELIGAFVLSDQALTVLLTRLCPRLSALTLQGCKKYTTEMLVELCEAHQSLDSVFTTRPITSRQIKDLRLERPRRIPRRYRERLGTEIESWYMRYLKSDQVGDLEHEEPVLIDGRHQQKYRPFCMYQMGRLRECFRRQML